MKVHPVADLFPMMSDDELANLADDIKRHGQLHPIIISGDAETLIDGRNRLRACELAGVQPQFQRLNGHIDPVDYILSSNDRRDMTQGQRAIVAAMVDSYKLYDHGDIAELARALKVPRPRVSEAITVVKHAPDLAEQVRRGKIPFHPALEKARALKNESDDNANKMSRLLEEAPDLADQVHDDRLTPGEAWAAFQERSRVAAEKEKSLRETLIRTAENAMAAASWANDEFVADLQARLADDEFRSALLARTRLASRAIPDIERGAANLAKILSTLNKGVSS